MAKVKTAIACVELNVSRDYLVSLIHAGHLQEGTHYINLSKGKKRPTYRWDVEAINQFFNRVTRSKN